MTERQNKSTGSTENRNKVNKEDSKGRGLQREGVRAPACRKGTLKRGLKYTGERYLCFYPRKFMESHNNFTLSECLVLPIMVLLAVVAYASLAAMFYNTDG